MVSLFPDSNIEILRYRDIGTSVQSRQTGQNTFGLYRQVLAYTLHYASLFKSCDSPFWGWGFLDLMNRRDLAQESLLIDEGEKPQNIYLS